MGGCSFIVAQLKSKKAMNTNTIIGKPDPYTIIPNAIIDHPTYKPVTKMIYIWLRSKRNIKDFDFWQTTILAALKIGDPKTLNKYIQPLIEDGWIYRERKKGENQIFENYKYIVNDYTFQHKPVGIIPTGASGNFSSMENFQHGKIPTIESKEPLESKELLKSKELCTPPTKNEIYLHILPIIRGFCNLPNDAPKSWARWETIKIYDHYEATKWKSGSRKIKDWKRAATNWINRAAEKGQFLKYDPKHPDFGKSQYVAPEKPQHKEIIPPEIRQLANRLKSK